MDQTLTEEERQARLAEAEIAYEAEIEANLKRNYAANLAHGLLGQTGFRLVNAPTFVPAYIFLLSGSEFAVGLALAAQWFGASASSIFGATLIEHRKRVLPMGLLIGWGMRPVSSGSRWAASSCRTISRSSPRLPFSACSAFSTACRR